MEQHEEDLEFDWRREALDVSVIGCLPALVVGWLAMAEVWSLKGNATHGHRGFPPSYKADWLVDVERYLLLPIETVAGLTAGFAVFALIALYRAAERLEEDERAD